LFFSKIRYFALANQALFQKRLPVFSYILFNCFIPKNEIYLSIYFDKFIYNIRLIMNKIDLNVEQLEHASVVLKAIAHPLRIAILNSLEGGKKLTVTEIHEHLDIEQSIASHHLGILRDKGILTAKREGKNTYYSIKDNMYNALIDCIGNCTNCNK
jgi:DNA-binding transcriptional ArsR family regulator